MKEFEYLEVAGTHEDVGRAIGTRFKNEIQVRVAERQERIENYENYLKGTTPYFEATKERFPELIDEVTAIAHGAGVGVADYFSINSREAMGSLPSDHCTVAVSIGEHGAVVGHNEDWEGATPNALYILKATIRDTTFLGLQYKVTIPGVAAAVNNWGLVQCINDLYQTSQIGVPKNFVARAVLECKTLDEAEKLIRETKMASGFNHVLVSGREVRNIEIAGDEIATQMVMAKPYVHTNHYLTPRMKAFEDYHTKSSVERYKRAREIIEPGMNVGEMEALLADTKNRKYPISRRGATLGSFVALPEEKKVFICYGPPSAGEYKEYK